ncbi:hypothetical protein K523DRAFT_362112 [Schizophyllum commune Tattone D]|nr:hypothetical protein K523DRAFT_362112 [Schizophyllum commune Tattone D]
MRFPQLPGLASLSLEVHAVVSRAALLEALDACAHTLVDLSLHLQCSSSALRSMNPIHFDVLRDLALGDAAYHILDDLAAPELQHIGLHAMVALLDGDPFPTLSTFLSRPSAPRKLEKLTLAVSVDETETFLQCLERMEELTHLSIHSTAFDGLAHESVFSRLTCREGESPLLPRLTAFQTALPPPDVRSSEAETALEEMITSRSTPRVCAFPGVAALVSVEINSNGMEDQPDESDACGESEGENEEEGYRIDVVGVVESRSRVEIDSDKRETSLTASIKRRSLVTEIISASITIRMVTDSTRARPAILRTPWALRITGINRTYQERKKNF